MFGRLYMVYWLHHSSGKRSQPIGVFYTSKNMVVKIAHSSFEMVLRTTKHTMIYLGSGSSLQVIAIRPAV
jgi:hypothetical protein